MRKYFRLSVVLTVIGALILGALGSGLWELLFKPLLFWVSTLFLSIATLGINSLRDDLYVEIAKGHDPSGLLVFTVIIMLGLVFFAAMAFFVLAALLAFNQLMRRRNLVRPEASRDRFSFFLLPDLPTTRIRLLRRLFLPPRSAPS